MAEIDGVKQGSLRKALKRWGEINRSRQSAHDPTDLQDGDPWWFDKAKLVAALAEHGSYNKISNALGGNPAASTLRHHGVRMNIPLPSRRAVKNIPSTPTEPDAPPPALARLDALDDQELTRIGEAIGARRAATALGLSEADLRAYTRERGIEFARKRAGSHPQIAALRRRVRELEGADDALDALTDSIREAAEETPPRVTIRPRVARKIGKPAHDSTVDVVLHVSDKQYGEVVHPEETPGGNYSPEIYAEQRLPKYLETAISIIQSTAEQYRIGTLWIANGGDYAEGEGVFKGQQWHLAMDAGQQVTTLGPLWGSAVVTLARAAKDAGAQHVALTSVIGNHGVHGGRSGGAVPPSLNYDHLTYAMARQHAMAHGGEDVIDFWDPRANRAVYFYAAGHVVLMSHGDQDRGGGLIGVAAVTGMRNDLAVRVQTGIDHAYHLKGHYHRPTSLSVGGDRRILWNGDWCGPNNLSVARGGGAPSQEVYVFHPEGGKIGQHTIALDRATRPEIDILDAASTPDLDVAA